MMINLTKQRLGSIAITTVLGAEAILLPLAARANAQPIQISQAPPWRQTYACGEFAITLSQEGTGDRYTYEAVNASGENLTISDGTMSSGRNYSSIYTFNGSDGSEYVLEDYGGGKADLSIGNYPDSSMTYSCTTDGT